MLPTTNSTNTIRNLMKQLIINEKTATVHLQKAEQCTRKHQSAQQLIDENLATLIQYFTFNLEFGMNYHAWPTKTLDLLSILDIANTLSDSSCTYVQISNEFVEFYKSCLRTIIHVELEKLVLTLQNIRDQLVHKNLHKVYKELTQLDPTTFNKIESYINDLKESLHTKVFIPKLRSYFEDTYTEIPLSVKTFLLSANNLTAIYKNADYALKFSLMVKRPNRYLILKKIKTNTLEKIPFFADIIKSSAINFKLAYVNNNISYDEFFLQLLYSDAAYLHPHQEKVQAVLQNEFPFYLRKAIISYEFYDAIMNVLPLPTCSQKQNCFIILTSPHNMAELEKGFNQLTHGQTLNPLDFISYVPKIPTKDNINSADELSYFIPLISFIALLGLMIRFIHTNINRRQSPMPTHDANLEEKKWLIPPTHTIWRKSEPGVIEIKSADNEVRFKHS